MRIIPAVVVIAAAVVTCAEAPSRPDVFAALLATGSDIADAIPGGGEPQHVPGTEGMDSARSDALGLLGLKRPFAPARGAARAVTSDQREAFALLETVERMGSMVRVRASQYFELIEDPLLNMAVPVVISIVISIAKMPIIMLLTEILNFFLMLLLAIPLALALYPGTDPASIPGAAGVPGMKPSSPMAQAVQSVQSSTTTTTSTVVEEEYEEFLQTDARIAASGIVRQTADGAWEMADPPPSMFPPRRERRAWRRQRTAARAAARAETVGGRAASLRHSGVVTSVLRLARLAGVSRDALLQTVGAHMDTLDRAGRAARAGGGAAAGAAAAAAGALSADKAVALAGRAVALLSRALGRRRRAGVDEAAFTSLLQEAAGRSGAGAEGAGAVPWSAEDEADAAAVVGWMRHRRRRRAEAAAPVSVLLQAAAGSAEAAASAAAAAGRAGSAFGGCEARRDAAGCTMSPLGDGTTCSWCSMEHEDGTRTGRCVLCRGSDDGVAPEKRDPGQRRWGSSSLLLSREGWTCGPGPGQCEAKKDDKAVKAAKDARAKAAKAGTELYPTSLRDDDYPAGDAPPPPDTPNNEMAEVAAKAASDSVGALMIGPLHAVTSAQLATSAHNAVARETSARLIRSLTLDLGSTLVARDLGPRLRRGITAGLSATLTSALAVDVAGVVSPTLALALTRDPSADHTCFLCQQKQVYCGMCKTSQQAAAATMSRGWLYGRYFGRVFGAEALGSVEGEAAKQLEALDAAVAKEDENA